MNRAGDAVGVPADADEVVVGVGEESQHVRCSAWTWSAGAASQIMKKVRVTKTAVIIEATMPMISVTAKPLTGPVPNWKRKSAVSTVLTLESTMAFMACLNPSSIARRTVLPCSSSSRIRSKISTLASTAMPTDSTMPGEARQRERGVDHRQPAEREQDVERERRPPRARRSAGSRPA